MSACTDNTILGCNIDSFPTIIAGLVGVALLLAVAWVALYLRDRYRNGAATPLAPKPLSRPVAPAGPKPAARPGPAPAPASPPAREPGPPAPPTPLQVRLPDAPDLRLAAFRGDLQVQARFATLLSAVLLSAQGWKQVRASLHGGGGLDGIFLREVKGGGGFECLAIQSLANGAPYHPAAMTDATLAAAITGLYEIGAFPKPLADELLRGLRQGPSFFRKELWRHDLSSGLTTICELDRNGAKGRSITRSNARLIASLFMSLEMFDAGAVYLGQAPLDADEASTSAPLRTVRPQGAGSSRSTFPASSSVVT